MVLFIINIDSLCGYKKDSVDPDQIADLDLRCFESWKLDF